MLIIIAQLGDAEDTINQTIEVYTKAIFLINKRFKR